jgi:hypothetical protein
VRIINGLLLLLLVKVSALPAQDPRLVARFPAAVAERLELIVDSARREGLPTDPLVLRALEGQAKGASTDQIVAVLGRLHLALASSRATLGRDAPAADVTTGADALQAGVPVARLQELHQLRGDLPLTVPLSAYLDLVARGASPDVAWTRIEDLARHRASDPEFRRLTPSGVHRDMPPGKPPGGSDSP